MRIFNGTKSQVTLPYVGGQHINIDPMSVSGNIGPTDELIALIVTSYTSDELALIVSGPYELSATSRNPVAVDYVVQTIDEAIQKLSKKNPAVKAEEPKKVYEAPKAEVEELKSGVLTEVVKEEEPKVEDPEAPKPKRGRGRPKKNA